MDSVNVRKALKVVRSNRRSYNASPKGWGKRFIARAERRLGRALAREC